jgi:hypothetical protein
LNVFPQTYDTLPQFQISLLFFIFAFSTPKAALLNKMLLFLFNMLWAVRASRAATLRVRYRSYLRAPLARSVLPRKRGSPPHRYRCVAQIPRKNPSRLPKKPFFLKWIRRMFKRIQA